MEVLDGRKWPSVLNIYKIVSYKHKNIHQLYHISSILRLVTSLGFGWLLQGRKNSLYKRIQYMTLDCIVIVSCLGSQNFSATLEYNHDSSSGKQTRMPAQADTKGLNFSCTSVLTNTVNLKIEQKVRKQFLLKLKKFWSL